ncbi:MAG: pirin family protein [Anaerolineae bacterium]|nr:pirin family protein [Anaerolineae bacterium]
MKYRPVTQVIDPQMVIEGADVLLRRSFGPSRANPLDPFLLFDNFAFNNPIEGPITGFPTHPHRGIETVTYMLEGNVRHRDSLGNIGNIGPGDVQWMTSGRGILHEEMPKRGANGLVNGFQLWVNLPSDQKMSEPRYRSITSTMIPTVDQNGAQVSIIAGEFEDVHGPVTEIEAQPVYMDISLDPQTTFKMEIPEGHSAMAYVFEGEGNFGVQESNPGDIVKAVQMVIFGEGNHLQVNTINHTKVRFLLISGAPFNEPIVPYGPFVMNTEEEIMQAYKELRDGTFVQGSKI